MRGLFIIYLFISSYLFSMVPEEIRDIEKLKRGFHSIIASEGYFSLSLKNMMDDCDTIPVDQRSYRHDHDKNGNLVIISNGTGLPVQEDQSE